MTEEIKNENRCCLSPEYKQFLLTILAAFLGCLVALCVFSAAVRPQMPPNYGHGGIDGPCPIKMEKQMKKHPKCKCNKHFKHDRIHKHQGDFRGIQGPERPQMPEGQPPKVDKK